MKPANAPSPFSDRIFLVRGVIYPLSLDIRPRNQRIVLRDFFRLFEKLKKFPCWKRSVVPFLLERGRLSRPREPRERYYTGLTRGLRADRRYSFRNGGDFFTDDDAAQLLFR